MLSGPCLDAQQAQAQAVFLKHEMRRHGPRRTLPHKPGAPSGITAAVWSRLWLSCFLVRKMVLRALMGITRRPKLASLPPVQVGGAASRSCEAQSRTLMTRVGPACARSVHMGYDPSSQQGFCLCACWTVACCIVFQLQRPDPWKKGDAVGKTVQGPESFRNISCLMFVIFPNVCPGSE